MSEQYPSFAKSTWKGWKTGEQICAEVSKEWKAFAGLFRSLCLLLLAYPTLIAEVFLHHGRFGARRLNTVSLAVGLGLVLLFTVRTRNSSTAEQWVGVTILIGFIVLAGLHLYDTWRDQRRGVRWHSRSVGLPYPFWRHFPGGQNPAFVMRYYEPLAVFIVGTLVSVLAGPEGALIQMVGGLLWVKHTMQDWHIRAQVLDQIDQQIEGEAMAEMVEGKRSPWEGEGFVVPPVALDMFGPSPSVEEARERLGERFSEKAPDSDVEVNTVAIAVADDAPAHNGQADDDRGRD